MKKTSLTPNLENFQSITAWLNNNFNETKCIQACGQQAKEIPTTKGIYFWFMDTSCYKKLKNTKALSPVYTKKINDKDYHLVYTGTAGVRNNSNGINNGNLNTRILWHLSGNKTVSSLRSGTMSTFRRTIGSLLADDNKIESDLIFYSLSPTGYENALKLKPEWHNLWVGNDRGKNSAKYLKKNLSRIN